MHEAVELGRADVSAYHRTLIDKYICLHRPVCALVAGVVFYAVGPTLCTFARIGRQVEILRLLNLVVFLIPSVELGGSSSISQPNCDRNAVRSEAFDAFRLIALSFTAGFPRFISSTIAAAASTAANAVKAILSFEDLTENTNTFLRPFVLISWIINIYASLFGIITVDKSCQNGNIIV